MTIFKRKIYGKMLEWKRDTDGSRALLIEGARRVGKSTIIEEFARNEYESYILVDFMFASKGIKELFEDLSDLDYFFMKLQLETKGSLVRRKSLIIFDEVQFCPLARQAIKRLVKDGRYDYIEAGSLTSVSQNVKGISIPSEERRISMYPMDFEEFLWATKNDTATMPLLKEAYEGSMPLGNAAGRRLMRDFRLYMLVGGMPQAVEEYLKSCDMRKVDNVKREILTIYKEDLVKIDSSGLAGKMFDSIPAQLSSNASRFKTSSAKKNARVLERENVVAMMSDSKTVLVSYCSDNPSASLAASKDLSTFKMYMADTGLFVTLMFYDKDFADNDVYKRLLDDKLSANLGYLYENAVAQMLTASGHKLFYHSWYDKEAHRSYEVDFLITNKWKISPVEVKSSGYRTHKSMDAFCAKYSHATDGRYLVYSKDYAKDADMTCLPYYMVPFL